MRIMWKSQTFLLQAIASIKQDIRSLPYLIWWHDNRQHAIISKKQEFLASAFFTGKLSLPQIIVQRCPQKQEEVLCEMIDFCWIFRSGCGDEGTRWQVERAPEWECEWQALVSGPTLASAPRLDFTSRSLSDHVIYLNLGPSDAKDETTSYKMAIS